MSKRERAPKSGGVAKLLGGLAAAAAFGILVYLERRRPLRREVESKPARNVRNLAVATLGFAALQAVERPLTERLCNLVSRREWGLLRRLRLPAWLELPGAVALLDYTLYFWHILTHRLPALWRFHVAHHADLDMDASTALRFHFGELTISVAWRAGQILLLGVDARSLSVWRNTLLLSILFHHSNVRLPVATERWLCRWLVTPRMHGIHHSVRREETDSNYSALLTLWDRLHGTLRLNVPQREITIGVPGYRRPAEVTLGRTLAMPWDRSKHAWLEEASEPSPMPRHHLAE